MKRFITTLGGKTLIFILCVISLCVFAAGALGMFFYLQDEMVFYSYSEQDLKKEIIEHDTARSYGYDVLWKQIADPPAGKYVYEYRITDEHGKKIAQSNNFDASKDNVYTFQYGIQKDASGAVYEFPYHAGDPYEENTSWYTVQLSFPEGSAEANEIALYEKLIHYLYAFRYAVYPIALAALVIAAVLFIALMYASGRRPDVDGFSGGALYRVPYDLLLLICVTLGIGLCFAADAVTNINDLNAIGKLICIAMLCLIGLNIILGLCMSAASRIKQHTLLKNTVIYRVIKLIWKILLCIWNLVKKLLLNFKKGIYEVTGFKSLKGNVSFNLHLIRNKAYTQTTTPAKPWLEPAMEQPARDSQQIFNQEMSKI